jgi:hypothetical protein
MRAPI